MKIFSKLIVFVDEIKLIANIHGRSHPLAKRDHTPHTHTHTHHPVENKSSKCAMFDEFLLIMIIDH